MNEQALLEADLAKDYVKTYLKEGVLEKWLEEAPKEHANCLRNMAPA